MQYCLSPTNEKSRAPRRAAASAPRGFSAIELLILVTGALVIAGLSVPFLRGLSLSTNSESAVETLVRARDFQIRFREKGIVTNAAGEPRFGNWNELLHAGLSLEDAVVRENGLILGRHGYLFQLHVAARVGDPVNNPADSNAAPSRNQFVIYAWPEDRGHSGASAFAIDPSGMLRTPAVTTVLESKNLRQRYSGFEAMPRWDAARADVPVAAAKAGESAPAAGSRPAQETLTHRGSDGEIWEQISPTSH